MGFHYQVIPENGFSGAHESVFIKGVFLGTAIKQGDYWFALKPGSQVYEKGTFSEKGEVAKHLAELKGIDWRV